MSRSYRGTGSASYHPSLLLGILVYGYATGVFSSRKLERATYDSVAFRFIAANDHPDHDTIATFRRRFLKEIEGLFVQVLARAEAADQADAPDGMSIPEELGRRKERLAKLAEARAKIEARAKERFEREKAEHEAKLAAREAKATAMGKKTGGKPPQPPVEGARPTDQINLTDEESRIMPVAGGGFEQCYNAQAVVTAGSLLVVAAQVVQAPNDKQQIEPMLDKIAALPEQLGKAQTLLA